MRKKRLSSNFPSEKVKVIFVFLLIFLLYFLTTSKTYLFYDASEYIKIVLSNSFFKSLSLGHNPIHPGFIGFLWPLARILKIVTGKDIELLANYIGLTCGYLSVIFFYKVAKKFFDKDKLISATLIFSIFPAVWLINTNLLVESFLLTAYLWTLKEFTDYLENPKRKFLIGFFLGNCILVFSHIQTIFWIPVIYSLIPVFYWQKEGKIKIGNSLIQLVKTSLFAFVFSFFLYALLFSASGENILNQLIGLFFLRVPEQFAGFSLIGILRMGRNILLNTARSFGTLIPLLFFFYLGFNILKNKKTLLLAVLTLVPLLVSGSVWTGEMMLRRMVFLGPFFALFLQKNFQKQIYWILAYLLLIFSFNFPLYIFSRKDMPFLLIQKMQAGLPKGNILVETHYLRPFTYGYEGKIFWVGQDDFSDMGKYLKDKEVFLDSQAVFAPYLLYVGNNLHITSLGRFGFSETKSFFGNYYFSLAKVEDAQKRVFTYSIKDKETPYKERKDISKKYVNEKDFVVIGKANPGSSVLVYSNKFKNRIHRERIDYADIFTWIWVLITNKKEPLFWTYADKAGIFTFPLSREEKGSFYLKGEDIKDVEILD